MTIEKNVAHVLHEIETCALAASRKPSEISLIVVSKNKDVESLKEAYRAGCRDFAESRIQEALAKIAECSADIRWHFVGHLQKNKVAKAVGHFVLIHSVDSVELALAISSESMKKGIKTKILLEANTSGEKTKGGLTGQTWRENFLSLLELEGIEIVGLMTMAPLTEDLSCIRSTFSSLRHLRDDLQSLAGTRAELSTLSMGMSRDYKIAIAEGATLVRIGSAIFAPHDAI